MSYAQKKPFRDRVSKRLFSFLKRLFKSCFSKNAGLSFARLFGGSPFYNIIYRMKKLICAAFAALVSLAVFGQNSASADSIHWRADRIPMLAGGPEAIHIFLKTNALFPKECRAGGVGGRTVLDCVVEKNGDLTNIAVGASATSRYEGDAEKMALAELLDKEALRVGRLLPRFQPALLDGAPVRFRMRLPVVFTND